MKKLLVILCCILGICVVIYTQIGTHPNNNVIQTISTTGTCTTTAPRDRTAITLRVTMLDKSAAKSMARATTKMNEITEYLRDMNVKMQTTDFNSYEKSQWNNKEQKSEILGIETTISVDISADNSDTIGKILAHFAGQDNIFTENLHMFTSTEAMQPVLDSCLAAAVRNARMRANALAAGDGRIAGKMITVSYGANAVTQPAPTNFLARSKMTMAAAPTMDAAIVSGGIVSTDMEISVTVSATFEIK
ncbi:MAG: SIMPL domain-containing protein [Alphaproteobacteria bacterium]|nr:SIMPL domain-containing protein [Alphaproteobacteria bacterium]